MESAATGGAAHPPGACDPPQNCGGYMSLVGHWEEAKFPAGINLVQTMAPGWRQIVSEVALDLITIPAVSALGVGGDLRRRKVCATTSTPAAWGAPLRFLDPFTPIFVKAELSEPMQKTIVNSLLFCAMTCKSS